MQVLFNDKEEGKEVRVWHQWQGVTILLLNSFGRR